MSPLTLTADEVAVAVGYHHRDGRPDRGKVRALARAGRLPAPIDSSLPVADWRWARPLVEQYVAGRWKAVAA